MMLLLVVMIIDRILTIQNRSGRRATSVRQQANKITLGQPVNLLALALHFPEPDILALAELPDAGQQRLPHLRPAQLPLEVLGQVAVFRPNRSFSQESPC